MSEYEDTDTDSDSVVTDSFAFLPKVKSNTPRARFDIHFHKNFIQLIQYSVQKEISNRYRIYEDNISEMLRLSYSNDKQIFFVLHLKRPIVGGNRSYTKYDFVVFNFIEDDYQDVHLDLTDPIVKDMFDEDIDDSGIISGKTIEIFERLMIKIFAKDIITPAKNYEGGNAAPGLPCTFWDSDEHFLYPLDNGFINVWKYCQKLLLSEVKDVRFVRSQGRYKTFDFYIYPNMERAIRRYNIGSSKSEHINCFFLEFKAIDQKYFDGLYEYCDRNQITISTNDFKESASGSSDSESESVSETETDASRSVDSNTEQSLDDDFEAPDPHMVRCQTEGQDNNDTELDISNEENSDVSEANDQISSDQSSTSEIRITSAQNTEKSRVFRRHRRIRQNIISDENDSSSNTSVANSLTDNSQDIKSTRKRSLRIESDDDNECTLVKKKLLTDSEPD